MNCTPVLYQSGVRTHTTRDAVFTVRDGWCKAHFVMSITQAGSAGNAITVQVAELPQPKDTYTGDHCGTFWLTTAAFTRYVGVAAWDGTEITMRSHLETGDFGVDPSYAVGNGDTLRIALNFEHL